MVSITVKGQRVRTYSYEERAATTPAPNKEAERFRRLRARKAGVERPKPEVILAATPDAPSAATVTLETAQSEDLAEVVTRKTLTRLASGELQPTLRDGLIAQQLIDRREEKAADRQFMLSLARALAGGGYEPPQNLLPATVPPPDDAIEGYFEEIPLAPEHLRAE